MSDELAVYRNFGKKAHWLFLSKWLEVPFVFLVLAFLFSIAGRTSVVPVQYKAAVSSGSLICLGISILSGIVSVIASNAIFNRQEFSLTNDAFKLRQGVLRKHEIAIPYRQIQNVDIERSLYQQMLGVSNLVIVTAGEDDPTTPENESAAVLGNVDKDLAVAIQDELLKRADVQRVVGVGQVQA